MRELLVAAHEAADRVHAEQRRRVDHALHEVVLLLPDGGVVVEHVVEVADVGEADAVLASSAAWTRFARVLVEGLAQVERVGHRVEHRLRRARRSRWGAARPRAGCSRRPARARTPTQSSIARSGSGSRTARGVSSCRAAVSTPIFMNLRLEGLHGHLASPRRRPGSCSGADDSPASGGASTPRRDQRPSRTPAGSGPRGRCSRPGEGPASTHIRDGFPSTATRSASNPASTTPIALLLPQHLRRDRGRGAERVERATGPAPRSSTTSPAIRVRLLGP